jgi:Myb-like DNA-binding protein REB1
MTVKQGRDIDNDVFWGRVSELMGGTRGRQQCRIKWQGNLTVHDEPLSIDHLS